MLISPTEPKVIRELGTTSLVPEQYGVDVLWPSEHFGLVGIQRKELSDFVASVQDGRLTKELGQMKSLGLAMLCLEGRPSWTNDGLATWTRTQWRITQHLGTLWSVQLSGCWIVTSTTAQETCTLISAFMKWTAKDRHTGMSQRSGPAAGEWGKSGNREWGMHLLQGFRGIGPVQAAAIYDHFQGVPLMWNVDFFDLMDVPGIGEKRAEQLLEAVNGRTSNDSETE